MLYIIAGIRHEFQNNLNKEYETEQSKYLRLLRHIIQEKAVDAIYEEWPPGSIPTTSSTLKVIDDVFCESRKKIVYCQIDLSAKERLHTNEECRKSCEKRKSMDDHREQRWVREIKNNYEEKSNFLLIVGRNHVENSFLCETFNDKSERFSLDTLLLKKLQNENINYEIIEFYPDSRAPGWDRKNSPKHLKIRGT